MTPPVGGPDADHPNADQRPPVHGRFPRHLRLRHRLEFARVFDARLRRSDGPITLHLCPNTLPHARLGLSISRRVGNAVRRNLLKRHLREAFRLSLGSLHHHDAGCYDLVISAHPHDEWPLSRYRETLIELSLALHDIWTRRQRRSAQRATPPSHGPE